MIARDEQHTVSDAGSVAVEARGGIAVVIVHYKTPAMVVDCVASLLPQLNGGGTETSETAVDEVVIVDNASGEADVAALREAARAGNWGGRVLLIESPANLGFAGANNLGIEAVRAARRNEGRAMPAFWMLLNPDTYLRPGAVDALLQFLRERPAVDCVGPRLEFPDGTAQLSAFGDQTPWSELLRGANIGVIARLLKRWEVYGEIKNQPHRAEWLAGACVLMRNEMLEKVGLLDAGFFMYFEEVDFFRRARRLNREVWHVPAARVVHLVGQSSGLDGGGKWVARRLPDYWFESRHRYFRKHFGYLGMLAADGMWLLGHAMMRLRRAFTGVSNSAVARLETTDLLRHSLRQMFRPGTGKTT